MKDFPRFGGSELAYIISSFMTLQHVPRDILNEINKQQTFSVFNKYSCFVFLESLVDGGYDEINELYDKLFD